MKHLLAALGIACTLVGCSEKATTNTAASTPDPSTVTQPATASPPEITVVGGHVRLDGADIVAIADLPAEPKTIPALRDGLAKRAAPSGERSVVLRADKDAPVLVINAVVRTASAAGYFTISLCSLTSEATERCSQLVLTQQPTP